MKKNLYLFAVLFFAVILISCKPSGIVGDQNNQNPKLIVYVTTFCPYCKRLEKYLQGRNISYLRLNISTDTDALNRYNRLGVSGVPVTQIGSHIITGFDPGALEPYLSNLDKS